MMFIRLNKRTGTGGGGRETVGISGRILGPAQRRFEMPTQKIGINNP